MKKTKYCKYEKFQIGPNTGTFSKCFFYKCLSTAPKVYFFENNASFLKKRIKKTSYTQSNGKYCKCKKFQIGYITGKFSKCFFYKRLSEKFQIGHFPVLFPI